MSERFTEAFLQDLKDRLPITDLVGDYVVWDKAKSRTGDMWACCPFHRENDASFHAVDRDGGYYKCFVCDAGGDHFKFLTESQGLSFPEAVAIVADKAGVPLPDAGSRERPAERRREPAPPQEQQREPQGKAPKWTPTGKKVEVATYDYTNGDGELLYQVVRFQSQLPDGSWEIDPRKGKAWKDFRQRRPTGLGDGSFFWGLKGGEFMRPKRGGNWIRFDQARWDDWGGGDRQTFGGEIPHGLYQLQRVELAIEAGETIFLVEGEKAAHAAMDLGLAATCNSGGSEKFHDDLLSPLRGADVVILPDNDAPKKRPDGSPMLHPDGRPKRAGLDHAEMVATKLRKIARSVKLLELPNLPLKGDIVEWIAAGGTREKLEELAAAAPIFKTKPPASKFRAFRIGDIGSADLRHQWLVDGILELKGTTALIGPTQSGKSFLIIELAFAIAMGKPFWGREVKQGLVLYQMGEGETGVAKRVEGYLKYHGIDKGEDVPLVVLPKKVNLFVDDKDTDELIAECKAWADHVGQPIRLLVIDTLNKAITGANEISGQDMGKVIARIERIKDELQCTVLLVHHMNAGGNRIRGHSSLVDDLTNVVEVQPLELTDENGRTIRSMKLDKNKDGEGKLTHRFVLRQVILDPGPDGKQRDTCVIDRPAGTDDSGRKEYSLTKAEREAYDALLKVLNDFGQPVPHGVAVPRDVTSVVGKGKWSAEVRNKFQFTPEDERLSAEEQQEKWTKEFNTAFVRMARNLQHAGIIGSDNTHGVVWWTRRPIQGYKRAESKASTTPPLPSDVKSELSGMEDIPF